MSWPLTPCKQNPCVHIIIPPASLSALKLQPAAPLFVAPPVPAAESQPRLTPPPPPPHSSSSHSAPAAAVASDPLFGTVAPVAPAAPLNSAATASAVAANLASLEAWAVYYERTSYEWLQRWSCTFDPQALASHELSAHYARGCRVRLSQFNSNQNFSHHATHQSSQSFNADVHARAESSAWLAAVGTADQQLAAAPVDLLPQAAAAQPEAANFVAPAAPDPLAAAGGFGAGLLALILRAGVTMCASLPPHVLPVSAAPLFAPLRYILSSSQPNGRMGWAVLACILIYLINSDRSAPSRASPLFVQLTRVLQAYQFAKARVSCHSLLQRS